MYSHYKNTCLIFASYKSENDSSHSDKAYDLYTTIDGDFIIFGRYIDKLENLHPGNNEIIKDFISNSLDDLIDKNTTDINEYICILVDNFISIDHWYVLKSS